MARTINQIQTSLEEGVKIEAANAGVVADPSLWSKTDHKKLILNQVATEHGVQEQLYDSLRKDVEDTREVLPPQTKIWIQDRMLNLFEYDSVAVPIIQLSSKLVPYYPNPNPNYRIIKYCSVVPGIFGTNLIKIAGAGPAPITGTALSAAQSFINTIAVPGLTYNVVSLVSDKLFIQADVYYNGLYSARIEADVTSSINNYLKSIPFNGIVTLTDLVIAIKNTVGVNDVVLYNVWARENAAGFGTGTNLVYNFTESTRNFETVAGYIVPETIGGKTLTDFRVGSSGPKNLNLIAQ